MTGRDPPTWFKIRVGMLRSEVGHGKRFLGPIFIIETDFEVVDLYSGGRILAVNDLFTAWSSKMSSTCANSLGAHFDASNGLLWKDISL